MPNNLTVAHKKAEARKTGKHHHCDNIPKEDSKRGKRIHESVGNSSEENYTDWNRLKALQERNAQKSAQGLPTRPDSAQKLPEKPKKKPAAHEVGPSRRANARRNQANQTDLTNINEFSIRSAHFYDFSDGRMILNSEQLQRLFQTFWNASFSSSELDYIIALADKNQDGGISVEEFPDVQEAARQHLKTKETVSKLFNMFDLDHDGGLEQAELKHLLTSLNDGVKVSDDEVAWVLKHSDQDKSNKVEQLELQQAITMWYNYTDDPPDNILLPKDHHKGGIIGRAMTGMHHHDKKHFEEHHHGKAPNSKSAFPAPNKPKTYVSNSIAGA